MINQLRHRLAMMTNDQPTSHRSCCTSFVRSTHTYVHHPMEGKSTSQAGLHKLIVNAAGHSIGFLGAPGGEDRGCLI